MADKKITELTNITGANLADADEFVVVDSSASETKAITRSELGLGINRLGYNGTQKIITTSTGVDVTGTVTADGLVVYETSGTIAEFRWADGVYNPRLFIKGSSEGISLENTYSSNASSLMFRTAGGVLRQKIENTGDISFYEDTGTTPKFFWDASAESLGIGTSSPFANAAYNSLTIGGSLRGLLALSNASAADVGYLFAASDNATTIETAGLADIALRATGAYNIRFHTNNTERMRITSTGNVGIGTSSPVGNMHLATSVGNTVLQMTGATGSTASNGLSLIVGAGGDASIYQREANYLRFGTSNAERMRITSAGNVGIGTSSPAYPLHVWSDTTIARFGGTDTGDTYLNFFKDSAATIIKVQASKAGTGATNLSINPDGGNVGIGTSSPAAPLDVVGGILSQGRLQIGATAPDLLFSASGGAVDSRIYNDGLGNFIFGHGVNSATPTERMRIDSSGNVGIGTSSPSFPISVSKTNGTYTDLETVFDGSISGGGGESSLSLSVQGDALGGYVSSNLTFSDNVASQSNVSRNSSFIKFGNATTGSRGTISFGGTGVGSTTEVESMRIDSAGSVLIGTSTGVSNNRLVIEQASGDGANSGFYLQRNGAAGQSFKIDIDSSDVVSFRRSTVQAMTITSTGNVGIGTSSPTVNLTFGATSSVIGLDTSDGADNKRLQLTSGGAVGTSRGAHINLYGNEYSFNAGDLHLVPGASGHIEFFTGAGSQAMTLDASGNLLVGKTATSFGTAGIALLANGGVTATKSADAPLGLNRLTSDGNILTFSKDGTTVGSIGVAGGTDSYFAGQSTSWRIRGDIYYPADASGNYVDNLKDIGSVTYRLDDIHATNGTIQTSDANEKQQIAELTAAEMKAAKAISKLFKTFKWNDSVAEKGDDARIHTGVIAQEVEAAMTDAGLDAGKYAFFISSTWWEADGQTYETAEEAPEGAVERTRKGIRYPQLLSFIGAATEQRLASIEARLDAANL